MPLAKQTAALLDSARDVVRSLPADAVLLLTETDLDWDDVYTHLKGCRALLAAESQELTNKLSKNTDLDVITLDPGPVPTREGDDVQVRVLAQLVRQLLALGGDQDPAPLQMG